MENINSMTRRVMQKIKVDELNIFGYMRKYQVSRSRVLELSGFVSAFGIYNSLYSEVLKIRLEAEKEILDYEFYKGVK